MLLNKNPSTAPYMHQTHLSHNTILQHFWTWYSFLVSIIYCPSAVTNPLTMRVTAVEDMSLLFPLQPRREYAFCLPLQNSVCHSFLNLGCHKYFLQQGIQFDCGFLNNLCLEEAVWLTIVAQVLSSPGLLWELNQSSTHYSHHVPLRYNEQGRQVIGYCFFHYRIPFILFIM